MSEKEKIFLFLFANKTFFPTLCESFAMKEVQKSNLFADSFDSVVYTEIQGAGDRGWWSVTGKYNKFIIIYGKYASFRRGMSQRVPDLIRSNFKEASSSSRPYWYRGSNRDRGYPFIPRPAVYYKIASVLYYILNVCFSSCTKHSRLQKI